MEMSILFWLVLCFYGYADVITLRLVEGVELDFSYRYFEVFSDGNLLDHVIGFQYGINAGVIIFVAVGMVKVLDGDSDVMKLGIDNILRVLIIARLRFL